MDINGDFYDSYVTWRLNPYLGRSQAQGSDQHDSHWDLAITYASWLPYDPKWILSSRRYPWPCSCCTPAESPPYALQPPNLSCWLADV